MRASIWFGVALLLSAVAPGTEHPFGRLNPNAPPETAHWGRLAGVWDCSLESRDENGTTTLQKATWTWQYTLDGYAVRDVYVGAPKAGQQTFYGTGLRVYNSSRRRWEIAWAANASSGDMKVTTYEATSRDGEVVMRYSDGKDPSWRTVFSDISDDAFEWSNEPSGQKMRCVRAPTRETPRTR